MLKITRKVEYALIAMRYLQNEGKNRIVPVKEISAKYSIPRELLAKILQQLGELPHLRILTSQFLKWKSDAVQAIGFQHF